MSADDALKPRTDVCPFCHTELEAAQSGRIWVPGAPITWGLGERTPRAAHKRLKDWKDAIAWRWRQRYPGPPLGGPFDLRFVFSVRSSRKDLTNLVKAAEDALKNVAFGDDDRTYRIVAVKCPVDKKAEEGLEFQLVRYHGPCFEAHLGSPS